MKKIYFLIKIAARPYGWLYISEIKTDGIYQVSKISYGKSKGMAKLMSKFEAEKLAESIRNWKGRRPAQVVVEHA